MKKVELEPKLAERFVNQLVTYTKYNINIMNDKGIIIASRNKDRVGTFHEVAYEIISSRQEMAIADEEDSYRGGVQPGVNLLLQYNNDPIGVIGVTGKPEEVYEIALIIKMSVETMIHYEFQREQAIRKKSTQEMFLFSLLKEENPSHKKLKEYAEKLNYNEKRIRVPLLFLCDGSKNSLEKALNAITHDDGFSSQDMAWIYDETHILVFKAVDEEPERALSAFRPEISSWLEQIRKGEFYERVFIGTMQKKLYHYRQGLACSRWLEDHIVSDSCEIWFYDYLEDYICGHLPLAELHSIFNVYDSAIDQEGQDAYLELIGSLRENNYNMSASSKELFLHKNTVAFRLNKLRDLFGMNPFKNYNERMFFDYLYIYWKSKKI